MKRRLPRHRRELTHADSIAEDSANVSLTHTGLEFPAHSPRSRGKGSGQAQVVFLFSVFTPTRLPAGQTRQLIQFHELWAEAANQFVWRHGRRADLSDNDAGGVVGENRGFQR